MYIHYIYIISLSLNFVVTMTEAYETLEGKRDETEEQFDERLLERAEADKERMSATKYVAGYITYKVSNGLIHNTC